MKAKDIRALSDQELQSKKDQLHKQLFDLQFQQKYGKVEKPHLFRQAKKDIARIETILRERTNGN